MAGQVGNPKDFTGQTANLNAGSAITLFTPVVSGVYRISAYQQVTVVDAVSSVMPSLTIGWTDPDISQAQTNALLATQNGNALTTFVQGVLVVKAKAAVAITATSASYASNTAATMTYSSSIRVEQM